MSLDSQEVMEPDNNWKTKISGLIDKVKEEIPIPPIPHLVQKRSGELCWLKLIILLVAFIILCFAIVVGYNCVNQKYCVYDFETNLIVQMLGTLCKIFA